MQDESTLGGMKEQRTIQHQDAAGAAGAPLGVFDGDTFLALVSTDDGQGDRSRAEYAARLGRPVEILLTCPNHPQTAAVDCTTCVPLDEE